MLSLIIWPSGSMLRLNKDGPRIEPLGTPHMTVVSSDNNNNKSDLYSAYCGSLRRIVRYIVSNGDKVVPFLYL